MHAATATQRPWITAGVALTAASMVAVAPLAPPTPPASALLDIQLTGLLEDTAGNITNLVDYFAGATPGVSPGDFLIPRVDVGTPFPILQQVITNQINNLGGVLGGTQSVGDVLSSTFNNLGAGLGAPFGMFPDVLATGGLLKVYGLGSAGNSAVEALIKAVLGVPDLSRLSLFTGIDGIPNLAGLLGLDPGLEGLVKGLLNLSAAPASGVLLGALGPVLGPGMVLVDGLGEVFGGDTGALLGIPGDMLNAFLNGGETLSLLPLLGLLDIDPDINVDLGILGSVTGGLDKLGLELGGLLSGPGSVFNALSLNAGLSLQGPCIPIFGCPPPISGGGTMLGEGAGPVGSLLAGQNSIADAINAGPLIDGLLPTITTGLGLDQLSDVFNDIQTFLMANLLDPVTGFLSGITDELAAGITSLLGSDLGIDALANMVFDIPQLLLMMLL